MLLLLGEVNSTVFSQPDEELRAETCASASRRPAVCLAMLAIEYRWAR
jgi:hypothetical protein